MKSAATILGGLLVLLLSGPLVWAADPAVVFVDAARAGAQAILTMDEDGANRSEIFRTIKRYGTGGPDLSPSISSDGWVAFVYQEDPLGPAWAIWKVGATGGDPALLMCSSGPNGAIILETPQWSPDGSEIAVIMRDFHVGEQSVVVVPASGIDCGTEPEVAYLTDDLSNGVTWSPDGSKLAVLVYDESGDDVLKVIVRETGQIIGSYPLAWPSDFLEGLLYKEPHGLDWKRSGELVFALDTYSEDAGGATSTVWLVQVTGGIAVPTAIAEGSSPTWAPDDAELLFGGPQGLTRIMVAGGGTEFLGDGHDPDWAHGPTVVGCSAHLDCNDGKECTEDLCNTSTGECSNLPLPDNTNCGINGWCELGSCFEPECTVNSDCNDGNVCTINTCSGWECFSDAAAAEGDPCDDGDGCTQNDQCDGFGGCVGDTVPGCGCLPKGASCSSNAECCSNSCHPRKGCR